MAVTGTGRKAATEAEPGIELEAIVAASLRALRAAVGNLASQFGYRRDMLNQVLLALGASRADVEVMRQFLLTHEPPEDDETT